MPWTAPGGAARVYQVHVGPRLCRARHPLPRPRPLPCVCRASDKCQRERRKTINGDDLLWAMDTLGFDEYIAVGRGRAAVFGIASVGKVSTRQAR